MKDKIEKPAILQLKETEEKIINVINTFGLPAFVIKPCLEKIYRQVEILELQELEKEKELYENKLKESTGEK